MTIDLLENETLQEITSLTFGEFKDNFNNSQLFYQTSALENYYSILQEYGRQENISNIENYALNTKQVVTNGSLAGYMTNTYMKANVSDNYVDDFSAGGDKWLQYYYQKIKLDFEYRKNTILEGGNGDIQYSDILTIDERALNDIGLPPEIHPHYVPLTQAAEVSADKAQHTFESLNSSTGTGWFDHVLTGLELRWSQVQSFLGSNTIWEGLYSIANSMKWQSDTINAYKQVIQDYQPTDTEEAVNLKIAEFIFGGFQKKLVRVEFVGRVGSELQKYEKLAEISQAGLVRLKVGFCDFLIKYRDEQRKSLQIL